jgi:hypothetical protein
MAKEYDKKTIKQKILNTKSNKLQDQLQIKYKANNKDIKRSSKMTDENT